MPLLDQGVPVVVEAQLRKALDAIDAPHLLQSPQAGPSLQALLMSADPANVTLALDLMTKGGVPSQVFEVLFWLAAYQGSNAEQGEKAGKLLAPHLPTAFMHDIEKHVYALNPHRVGTLLDSRASDAIESLVQKSAGRLNGVRIAQLFECGYRYLFEAAKDDAVLMRHMLQMPRFRAGSKLEMVDLDLRSLPSQMAELTDLTHLYLDRNRLTEIPPFICGMSELEVLEVWSNNLASLPQAISRLTKLRVLVANLNQFVSFPVEVFGLPKLQCLSLLTCDPQFSFAAIPDGIHVLSELEDLSLSGHPIAFFSKGLLQLPKLKKLHLANCQLVFLPAWIAQLPALQEIDLSGTTVAQGSIDEVVTALRARGVQVKGRE